MHIICQGTYREGLGSNIAIGMRHECQQYSRLGKYSHDKNIHTDRSAGTTACDDH